jgi:hypothetical protein
MLERRATIVGRLTRQEGAPARVFRLVMLAVPCALVLANVFGGSSLASQSSGEEAPCLKRRHLPAFTAYDLGSEFDGLPLTSVERSCLAPPSAKHRLGEPASVAWTSYATYGTCTPEGFEGGCAPPLGIQSGPECDRNFSSYGVVKPARALRPRKSFFLSGSHKIPTAALEYGRFGATLEMYTGQTTVVIFSHGNPDPPSLARLAAHALARLIAPRLSGISAKRLRALAVDPHGCGQGRRPR